MMSTGLLAFVVLGVVIVGGVLVWAASGGKRED